MGTDPSLGKATCRCRILLLEAGLRASIVLLKVLSLNVLMYHGDDLLEHIRQQR